MHRLQFKQIACDQKTAGGSRVVANRDNFPVLRGMALYKLHLQPGGVREPHWHPNADELGYCLRGEAIINLYDTGDVKATFLVQPGDAFFIPSGALHHIENVGKGPFECLLQFSHERPEDFSLSAAFASFSKEVLGNTWGVAGDVFSGVGHFPSGSFAQLRKGSAVIPDAARYKTPYCYSLEGAAPIVQEEGGSARVARGNVWPILRRQALYSLILEKSGMREPHWHPETAELGFVEKGKMRMTILHPSSPPETFVAEAGDIYFIPKGYPHHIENLEGEKLHILIFFDQAMPSDIGFTGSVRSYTDEVLGASLGIDPAFFHRLRKDYADRFIVDKVNL